MNACPPDDLSAYSGHASEPTDLVFASTVVGDADESSGVPTPPLDSDAGMPWIGPEPLV